MDVKVRVCVIMYMDVKVRMLGRKRTATHLNDIKKANGDAMGAPCVYESERARAISGC